MPYAKKCDRCGKCFDPLEAKGELCTFRVPTLYTAKNAKELTRGEPIIPGRAADDMFDLCEDCTRAFKIFMKPAKNGGDTDGNQENHGSDAFDDIVGILQRSIFGGGGK